MNNELIKVAIIADAHGIKGEVKLHSFIENPDFFSSNSLFWGKDGKKEFSTKVTGIAKNAIIVRIDGVNDRNSAELLKNTELFAPESLLPALDEGEFYHSQLIGLEARLENAEKIGIITAVHNYGAGDIVEIIKDSGESEMLPLTAPWVSEINIEHDFIIITLPEYS